MLNTNIEASWAKVLNEEFDKPYFKEIERHIAEDKANGDIIYPPEELVFNAFNKTPFNKVKVVILGQDPYHGAGQAHGLSFSVPYGVKLPPSLKNIYKELATDIGMTIPTHGNLETWAEQGVFLLNAFLTVKASDAGSHSKIGWGQFTDAVISKLSSEREGLVFMLWGKFAQDKAALIDSSKHHILEAPHPSPFSARKGFFGCKHFSKTNEILKAQNKEPIDWVLPSSGQLF